MEDQDQIEELTLAEMQDAIDGLHNDYEKTIDKKVKKQLAAQMKALMSDYNERVGFLAYDEDKY